MRSENLCKEDMAPRSAHRDVAFDGRGICMLRAVGRYRFAFQTVAVYVHPEFRLVEGRQDGQPAVFTPISRRG